MKRGGNPDFQHRLCRRPMNSILPPIQCQHARLMLFEIQERPEQGDQLRNLCCDCRAACTPLEARHKQQIQKYIGNRRHRREVQRPLGIAHAPQERGNRAVEERDQKADGADHQIVLRLAPRLRGHIDQTEDRADEAADDHRDHHCHNRADGKGRSHRPVNALLIFCPAILGDQHRRTGAGPQTDIAGGIADIGHVVYRSQSRRAAELPHNDRIHRGVQGLQYTGRQKRQ